MEVPAQQVHDRIAAQAFEGLHRSAVAHRGKQQARAGRKPVDQHGAGAAGAVLAAEMRRGETAALAQEVGERQARLDVVDDLHAVEIDGQRGHWLRMSLMARRMLAPCIRVW